MVFGTVIRMKSGDSLITQAMLSSYIEVERKDYLSLIEPFLLKSLPDEKGALIEIEDIQKALNEDYDLEILYNVVEKLLQRLCKKKRGEYVRREFGHFFLNREYDDSVFNENKRKIKESLEAVINKFQKFLIEEKRRTRTTREEAEEYIAVFLDSYNYSIYENVDRANSITIGDEFARSNFYVAQFLLKEYEEKTLIFDYFMEIIKGTLAAKSIYYFMYENKPSITNKIQNTDFYLDTRLLIGVLGMNSHQEELAMTEMMKLIKENGGRCKTFEHYVDELRGILYKYAKDPTSRLNLSLQNFNAKNYSSLDAEKFMETLVIRLEQKEIEIVELPDYKENIEAQEWHIDYSELRKQLSDNINYSGSANGYYSEQLNNDANTIEAISYLRGKPHKCSIDNCKSIFVTKNKDIVKVVDDMFRKERFNKGEINFAITDVDLTAMLWLSTFGSKSELPQLKLLENVYAACMPSNKVMKAFLAQVEKMEESDLINQETAILLRTKYSMLDDLMDLTGNVSQSVNEGTIYEMQARLTNRAKRQATIEVKEKLKNEIEIVQNENKLAEKERADVEERRQELIQMQRAIAKDKQALERKERDILFAENRIANQKNKIVCEAKMKAKRWKNLTTFVVGGIMLMFCVLLVIVFIGVTYKLADFSKADLISEYVLAGIISVIGLICTVFSWHKFLGNMAVRISEHVYENVYEIQIQKNREFFDVE